MGLLAVGLVVGPVVLLWPPVGYNHPVQDHRLHCRQQMLTLQDLPLPVVHWSLVEYVPTRPLRLWYPYWYRQHPPVRALESSAMSFAL